MKIGFTGTRNGMTLEQTEAFRQLIAELKPTEFHHGDCIGADAEAHDIVREFPHTKIVIHQPVDEKHRAWKKGDEFKHPLSHFARNRAIVDETELLIGASISDVPLTSGGTWYTIDYAIKIGRPVRILWPDGSVEGAKVCPKWM